MCDGTEPVRNRPAYMIPDGLWMGQSSEPVMSIGLNLADLIIQAFYPNSVCWGDSARAPNTSWMSCTSSAAPCDWVINKQEEERKLNDVRPADVISAARYGGFDASDSAGVIQGVRNCTEIQKGCIYFNGVGGGMPILTGYAFVFTALSLKDA